jgi:proteasome accessory factor B
VTAKTERLVNLTVALLASRRPLTFAELRSKMGEWDDGAPESMRRKFERDKEELRSLGVPIETVGVDATGGEVAYWIDGDDYALPPVELSAEQMTVLAVAFQLVDGGVDQLTFSRVAALAPDPDPDDVTAPMGISVQPADLDAVAPLSSAIVEGRVVRFRHRKPNGEITERELEPTALLARRGTWYVRGLDRTRDAERLFRTDRIVGQVELTDEPVSQAARDSDGVDVESVFDLPDEIDLRVAVRDLDGWDVETRRDRWFRATARALGSAPDEVILEPADAHASVVEGLHAVLAAHGAEVDQ